jgi:hypothetical protein
MIKKILCYLELQKRHQVTFYSYQEGCSAGLIVIWGINILSFEVTAQQFTYSGLSST